MKDKINIAELLKDCPKGMELDCTMFEGAFLERVDNDVKYPIAIRIGKNDIKHLTKEGCWNTCSNAKCVIFPKGKNTWEGFVPPCQFKNGDILVHIQNDRFVMSIYKSSGIEIIINTHVILWDREEGLSIGMQICCYPDNVRLATEEEKQKLFKAIKDNGYRWNNETKTLEKLIEPKFNVGDRVRPKNTPSFIVTINDIAENSYWYGCNNAFWIEDQDEWELVPMIEPKFKIGDKIKEIRTGKVYTVTDIYGCNEHISFQVDNSGFAVDFSWQDEYELVPNKFDINTLKPFKSRVLVRNFEDGKWRAAFWGFYNRDEECHKYSTTLMDAVYCIPYEGNEHLLGKTDDCDEYYKTWK